MSDGAAPLTRQHAMSLRTRIVASIRHDGFAEQAARLNKLGSGGYPDEEDYKYFVAEVGFSFAIVQDTISAPLVYGSERGPVQLTLRRCYVTHGQGHQPRHYNIVSYEAPAIKTYHELTFSRLDGYKDFLCQALSADRTIGNTQLINLLEEEHGVSAKTSTMKHWRKANKRAIASIACITLGTPIVGFCFAMVEIDCFVYHRRRCGRCAQFFEPCFVIEVFPMADAVGRFLR